MTTHVEPVTIDGAVSSANPFYKEHFVKELILSYGICKTIYQKDVQT